MRVLIYEWSKTSGFLYKQDIRDVLKKMNISYDTFQFDFKTQGMDELEKQFTQIGHSTYDACFSINYWPGLSKVCQKHNVKYIAWGYDCPFNVRNIEETLGNTCNYLFCFDRNQATEYQSMGFQTVYYLPLAAHTERYSNMVVSNAQREKYSADISFIGSLYKGLYSGIAEICDEYVRGYLEGVIQSQLQLYGAYILNDTISDELVNRINTHFLELEPNTSFKMDKVGLVHTIDQETSRRERLILLDLLGKKYDTHLYTYDPDDILKNVHMHGQVDYFTEMPLIFASSKINLNITVKGIQTGMPLRIFDVMASGGFLLSNYQSEFGDFFDCEKDLILYESIEDAYEKCQFYLSHDDLREKIAENGKARVFADHKLIDRMSLMFKIAGLI